MTRQVSTFALRMPNSLKAAAARMAAAEKLSTIQTAEAYFSALRGQGDREAALAFLSRAGGKAPRSGDEQP